jgi:hypothetical protein
MNLSVVAIDHLKKQREKDEQLEKRRKRMLPSSLSFEALPPLLHKFLQ